MPATKTDRRPPERPGDIEKLKEDIAEHIHQMLHTDLPEEVKPEGFAFSDPQTLRTFVADYLWDRNIGYLSIDADETSREVRVEFPTDEVLVLVLAQGDVCW